MSNEVDSGGWASALDCCPHVDESVIIPDDVKIIPDLSENIECCVSNCFCKECWLCLYCLEIFCGRYGSGHMINHYNSSSNHCIALGIGDLSFWCYQCDSYINHLTINRVFKIYEICHLSKFKEYVPKDLIRQYTQNIDDDKEDEYDEYELFINMDLKLKEIQSKLEKPKNSLLMIDELIARFNIDDNKSNTYLYYNDNMLLHVANKEIHENPDRMIKTIEYLSEIDLLNKCTLKKQKIIINDDDYNDDPNLSVLTNKYKLITDRLNNKIIDEIAWFDSYTFFNKYSEKALKTAYLSCFDLFNNLLNNNKYKNYGFGLIRPPGHHCNYCKPMGFCLVNNVGIGINMLRSNIKCSKYCKFLIIDLDIHHGNGTQDIFYNDPNVVYMSIHEGIRQFNINGIEGISNTSTGSINDIGINGTNINIPLNVYNNYNQYGYGDNEYLILINKLIIPILKEFNPNLCIISNGFDAGIGDKMGKFRITPICYGLIIRLIINACKSNKVAIILEGGYNLCTMPRSIGCCIYSLLKGKTNNNLTLNQYENEFINSLNKQQQIIFNQWKLFKKHNITKQHQQNNINEINTVIQKVTKIHAKYWKCFT